MKDISIPTVKWSFLFNSSQSSLKILIKNNIIHMLLHQGLIHTCKSNCNIVKNFYLRIFLQQSLYVERAMITWTPLHNLQSYSFCNSLFLLFIYFFLKKNYSKSPLTYYSNNHFIFSEIINNKPLNFNLRKLIFKKFK